LKLIAGLLEADLRLPPTRQQRHLNARRSRRTRSLSITLDCAGVSAAAPMSAFINVNELRTVGMSRSGNHAILNWIISQARGRVCFLNCAEPGENPFAWARPLSPGQPGAWSNYSGFDGAAETAGELTRKDWLIHSYEDTFLDYLCQPEYERERQRFTGTSSRRIDILIVRDPFNLFASRIAFGRCILPHRNAAEIWCQHARELLGLERNLTGDFVAISYNRWVSSRGYRRGIARRLGLKHNDSAALRVAACGGGSSFDGTDHDGRALEMDVFGRWRAYAGDEEYRAIFTPELRRLAHAASDHSSA
jgi:hypothetical protein